MPGLAHFCEHLLFMVRLTSILFLRPDYTFALLGHRTVSSWKWVFGGAPDLFSPWSIWSIRRNQYLAKNNGRSNAYTSTSNTNYYFNVATPALSGALERFAGFFHSPLFAPSCTLRELNAVDSEHKKNHQADLWRIFQVTKHISRDGHVWHKFGSGNRDSLLKSAKDLKARGKLMENGTASYYNSVSSSSVPSRMPSPVPSITPSVASNSSESDDDGGSVGRETRRRLVEWWSKEYCASRMRLCIIGRGAYASLLWSILFSQLHKNHWTSFPSLLLSCFLPFRIVDKTPSIWSMNIHLDRGTNVYVPCSYLPFNFLLLTSR